MDEKRPSSESEFRRDRLMFSLDISYSNSRRNRTTDKDRTVLAGLGSIFNF